MDFIFKDDEQSWKNVASEQSYRLVCLPSHIMHIQLLLPCSLASLVMKMSSSIIHDIQLLHGCIKRGFVAAPLKLSEGKALYLCHYVVLRKHGDPLVLQQISFSLHRSSLNTLLPPFGSVVSELQTRGIV